MQSLGALAPSPDKLLTAPQHSPQQVAWATKMAAILFGSYPNAKAHDPEVFTAQVVRMFLRYEPRVVTHVVETLPTERTGNWDGLPSMARIAESLEARAHLLARDAERDARIERQLAEREEDQTRPRPTYAELQARCHAVGLMIGKADRPPPLSKSEREAFMAAHGISQEQWDAIPEAQP